MDASAYLKSTYLDLVNATLVTPVLSAGQPQTAKHAPSLSSRQRLLKPIVFGSNPSRHADWTCSCTQPARRSKHVKHPKLLLGRLNGLPLDDPTNDPPDDPHSSEGSKIPGSLASWSIVPNPGFTIGRGTMQGQATPSKHRGF